MTLPSSGPISFNAINVELGQPGATNANINQASYRTLAGIPTSGATISLSNFYGKSNRPAASYVFTANTQNASLNIAAISGYVAGITDVTVTVNPSVYLWSSANTTPGLTLTGGTAGDTLTLVNNGFIMGMGGTGNISSANALSAGGPAISLGYPITINNTNPAAYIGGGGGGGGSTGGPKVFVSGGGGAGGGPANATAGVTPALPASPGGAIGASGSNGAIGPGAGGNSFGRGGGAGGGGGTNEITPPGVPNRPSQGGGGGRIFPGTGGAGGTCGGLFPGTGGTGGSANAAGGNGVSAPANRESAGGAGGGWGANGGTAAQGATGGTGGRAVLLNGRTVTWTSGNTTRVYGAVS
jgi:hypothetical protein